MLARVETNWSEVEHARMGGIPSAEEGQSAKVIDPLPGGKVGPPNMHGYLEGFDHDCLGAGACLDGTPLLY